MTPPDTVMGRPGWRWRISGGGVQDGQDTMRLIFSVPVQVKPSRPTEIG